MTNETTGKPQRYAIVGMQHIKNVDAKGIVDSVPHHQQVTLVRDPTNKYDPNAVQVWIDGIRVGFIPKTQNAVLSKYIDNVGRMFLPPAPMAGDGAMPSDAAATKCVSARIHRGNSPVPLVEIA